MKLSDPLTVLDGVGDKLSADFSQLGIDSIEDLLFYLPRRHQDFSQVQTVHQIKPGNVSLKIKLTNVITRRGRRGIVITEAIASDETDSVKVIWFNQPYREKSIEKKEIYFLSGVYKLGRGQMSIINPSLELAKDMPLNAARILPIYKETKNINSRLIRRLITQVLPLTNKIKDLLPKDLIKSVGLVAQSDSIREIHYPLSLDQLKQAETRQKFNELLPIILANELSKRTRLSQPTIQIPFDQNLAIEFVAKLPFKLTDDQKRAIWQVYLDINSNYPMNRLIEGDVGSGKTVVCVMSAVMAQAAGYKVAFMAPTELLARQHAETIHKLLKPLGLEDSLILLTGSMSIKQKKLAINLINEKNNAFVVGTHSLLTSGADWSRLALLIIDEQHRFGVDQRQQLQQQVLHLPHCLSLTATPIPRSLALTFLSDLDLTRIKTLPSHKKDIKSELVSPASTKAFHEKIKDELKKGRQVYIVCPYIHSIDKKPDLSLETILGLYQTKYSKQGVAAIHGQMPAEQQNQVMEDFITKKIQILVATTVIEVGVDVANATIMAIYGPERFGLAQLHQLRGRVGRGEHQSHCFLMLSDNLSPPDRLRQFVNTTDGFKLSELDLSIRGPGAIYGKLQHGRGLISYTLDDKELMQSIKIAIDIFFNNGYKLLEYKELSKRVMQAQQLTYLN